MAALTRLRKLSDERGSQIIEASLVLPLLLLMVLGILDFGMLFWRFESVTNAAREGARVAILPGYSSTDVTNRVQQYLTNAGLTATPTISVVAPAGVDVGGGTCITMTGATVSYPHDFFLVGGLVGYFGSGALTSTQLNATAMMRYEGGALPCP
jgi:Flp pilus assembly protein TadG